MALILPEFPIECYIGPNGSGKTYAAVHRCALPAWEQGRQVASNMALFPERGGFDPELYVPLESWRQISSFENLVLILDEISSVLPSRQASTVPPDLMRRLNQLRKVNVRIVWTAPSWARCDKALREVTQAVTVCRSRLPDRWQRVDGTARGVLSSGKIARNENGRKLPSPAGWEPRRWFTWVTYDAQQFDEFTYDTAKRVKPKFVQHHWRPGKSTNVLYRTLQEVGLLDHLDDAGQCVACGGWRKREACSCERPQIRPLSSTRGPVRNKAERREATLT